MGYYIKRQNYKRLCHELNIFLTRDGYDDILYYFKINNIKLKANDDTIVVTTHNNIYTVGIIIENDSYYWYLEPYNNSYFLSKSALKGNFDMILLAIKENEELYTKK